MSCDTVRQQIEEMVVRRDGARMKKIHAHLAQCAACSDFYSLIFETEAVFEHSDRPDRLISSAEATLLRQRVLAEHRSRRLWQKAWPYASAAAAVAAALILVLLLKGRPAPGREEFAVRGGPQTAEAANALGLRALCLSQSPRGIEVRSLGTKPLAGEQPRCSERDELGFASRNESGRNWRLRLFLVAPSGAVIKASDEIAVPSNATETPLKPILSLGRIGAGRARIFAVFSESSLAENTLMHAAGAGQPLEAFKAEGAARVVELVIDIGKGRQ
jgi:hypothetical protein